MTEVGTLIVNISNYVHVFKVLIICFV